MRNTPYFCVVPCEAGATQDTMPFLYVSIMNAYIFGSYSSSFGASMTA